MGRHATSYNVITDAMADYLTLLVLAVRFIADLVSSVVPKPRREVVWPTGADEAYAEQLHAMQMSAEEKRELAREVFQERTADANTWYQEEVDA